jgi:hypothetical protein
MKPIAKRIFAREGLTTKAEQDAYVRDQQDQVMERVADFCSYQQRMGDRARYQQRVFDQGSQDLARQRNKEDDLKEEK